MHHALQYAFLLGTKRFQVDVPIGPEVTHVVEMFVLQPKEVPDEATTKQAHSKGQVSSRRRRRHSPRYLQDAGAGLNVVR